MKLKQQFFILVFCASLNYILAQVRLMKCKCGVSNEGIASRIVGGEVSQPHVYPWVVAIYSSNNLHCGGSLINSQYILTAGHCVRWNDPRELTVMLGMHERFTDGMEVQISKVILHPDFTSDELHDTNDIALIRLKHPVRFTDEISPVCLPHPLSDYSGRRAIVAGWGRLGVKDDPSDELRQADVNVISMNECKKTILSSHLTDNVLCAITPNVDACQGDSGGPLLYERRPSRIEQIGVVSWGIGCATPGVPGVYTKVTDFLDWIVDNTLDAAYCSENN